MIEQEEDQRRAIIARDYSNHLTNIYYWLTQNRALPIKGRLLRRVSYRNVWIIKGDTVES